MFTINNGSQPFAREGNYSCLCGYNVILDQHILCQLTTEIWNLKLLKSEITHWLTGCVYYRALVHFKHWLSVLRAFTLTEPAEFRALKVPGWRTANGKRMQCKTMDTTHPKRAPSWLRSGRGGALSAAFHKKHVYFGRFSFAGVASRFASVTSALDSRGVASRFASVTSAKWLT